MSKLFDINKIKFEINWASGTMLVGAISACIYFYAENQSLKSTINSINDNYVELRKENDNLKLDNAELKGKIAGIEHTSQEFMKHSPGLLDYRLNILENLHPEIRVNGPGMPDTTIVHNR